MNLLLGENLGEIRGRIPARFWPPGSLLPGENLGKIRGRIPARFWPPGFLLPGENLGEIRGRIPERFWPPGISFPGEIPAGKKNHGGQNLAEIPTGFPPRSRRDPAKIPVLILQGSDHSISRISVIRGDSGRIHYNWHIFNLKNHI